MPLLKLVKPHLSPRENRITNRDCFYSTRKISPVFQLCAELTLGLGSRFSPAHTLQLQLQVTLGSLATPLPHTQLIHSFYSSKVHPLGSSRPWEPQQLPLRLSDPFMIMFSKVSFILKLHSIIHFLQHHIPTWKSTICLPSVLICKKFYRLHGYVRITKLFQPQFPYQARNFLLCDRLFLGECNTLPGGMQNPQNREPHNRSK